MLQASLTNSQEAYMFLKPRFSASQEELWAVALSSELYVLGTRMIFRGTVDLCLVHPRELFAFLIQKKSSFFMIAHNHPTGLCQPSIQDLTTTRKLWKVGRLMEIPMADHLIFGNDGYFSLADHGFFKGLR